MTTIESTPRTTAVKNSLWLSTACSAAVAAAATTIVAAAGREAGASLKLDGEDLPLSGVFTLTLMCVAVGFVLAVAVRRWASHPRQAFVRATVALTALSFVPDLLVSASTGTRATLMTTHLVAAAIVIPVVASRLPSKKS
ncbi:MAG: DUF6069 family protein [Aeromicrobium sp.]